MKSIANVDYIRKIPKSLGDIVISGYVIALRTSFGKLPKVYKLSLHAFRRLTVAKASFWHFLSSGWLQASFSENVGYRC